uniref:Uncharacterized protein n=1 Tax=Arundo donax TaxID=35708 RepID=A0A0A8YKW2_ARUDO
MLVMYSLKSNKSKTTLLN